MTTKLKITIISVITILIGMFYIQSTKNQDKNGVKATTHILKKFDSKIDEASTIFNGKLIVRRENKFGILKDDGTIIEEIKYDRIIKLSGDVYYFQLGKIGEIKDLNSKKSYNIEELNVIPSSGFYKVMLQGKYGVLTKKLEEVLPIEYDYIDYNNKYILGFKDGIKELYTIQGEREKLELEREYIRLGIGDYFYLNENNSWIIVDENKNKITKNSYNSFLDLNKKNILIGYKGNEKYFLNLDEKIEKKVDYENFGEEVDGIIMVLKEGKIGYIDYKGNEIITTKYDGGFMVQENQMFFQVKDGEKWLLLDKQGKKYKELPYNDLGEYSEGYILVEKNGKFGYINKEGKEVIPLDYTYANSFKNNLAIVANENGFGVIDKENKVVIPLIYDELDIVGDYIYVIQDSKAGLLTKTGEEILPLIYDSMGRVENNTIFVKQQDKVGYIEIKGGKN